MSDFFNNLDYLVIGFFLGAVWQKRKNLWGIWSRGLGK